MQNRVILCYGDSNTHGTCPMTRLGERNRHRPGERWPGVLGAALGEGFTVIDEGLPGRTTLHPDPIEGAFLNGKAVLPAILGSHRPVDLLLVMLGTNDLKTRFGLSALDIALSVEHLVLAARQDAAAPGGVLVIAPPSIGEAGCLAGIFAGGAAKSRALAPLLAEVADRAGAGFFDSGTVAAAHPLDGVHLDAAAHRALGGALTPHVRAMIPGGTDHAQGHR